ncbi:MAG TPA: hypothetical protein VEG40_02400 [Gaiellaceae bacterium]|nr:hypothetical protein [Gaiellaceae bacterium]
MTRRTQLVALLAAGLALAPTFAHATTPGSNGKIVFTRYRLQDNPLWSEIYVANQDGSGEHRVSHSARARLDNQAHWSPDGKLIVFRRCAEFTCSIWLVKLGGTEQHPLTRVCNARPPACPDNGHPSFAPDGRHVVFVHETGRIKRDQIANSEIVMTDLQGRHMKVLRRSTGFRFGFGQPQLSPDATRLVFRRYNSWRTRPASRRAIFVVNVKGGGLRRLTPWSLRATGPDWSPDGSRILFASNPPADDNLAPGTDLYSIRPDGTDLRRITNVGPDHYVLAGSYSPDGKAIVYATDLDATPKPPGGSAFPDIVTQPLGGGPVTHITHSANLDGWPAWGPSEVTP